MGGTVAKLSINKIIDAARSMEREFELMREQAKARYELYGLRRDPYVPEEIAREGKMRINSPLLINATQTIRSDILMNPTEFSIIPLARERDGAVPHKLTGLAENLERSDAIIWGRLNEARHLDLEVIFHQLVSPLAILCLGFDEFVVPEQPEWMSDEVYIEYVEHAEANFLPWYVYAPDPLTCAWLEERGKPTCFTRHYKALTYDVEQMYSKKRGSAEPEAYLRLNGEGRYSWLSDDYSLNINRQLGMEFYETELIYYDDGQYIYHIVLNPCGDGGGEVVWSCPNPVGRPLAFLIPGNVTPFRKPEEKYEPFLWPLMQAISQINDLRSMRATAARNLAGPHTYIAMDPEIVKIYDKRGEKLPTSVRFKRNETHYLLGKVETMPSELSPDWDKLETMINEETQRYLPSQFVNVVDPAVLKAATATSILHAAEAGLRLYGPLMSHYDSAIKDIFECIHQSIRTYYPDLSIALHADGTEMARGRTLKQGSVYRLDAKSVNFPYRLTVRTRGMSQAQASAQYDSVLKQWSLPDGSRGPATMDDLINAANYTDPIAQKMKLATESIVNEADPWLRQQVIQKVVEYVKADSGIDLQIGPPPGLEALMGGGAPGGDQPAGLPNSAQRMDSPLIVGPQGGSDSTAMGVDPSV